MARGHIGADEVHGAGLQSHQHGRPDDGVETQNLLADHVDVSGPVLIKVVVGIVIIAQCGDVVGKCIDPHIDGVLGSNGTWMPQETLVRDTQVSCRPCLMKAIISFCG